MQIAFHKKLFIIFCFHYMSQSAKIVCIGFIEFNVHTNWLRKKILQTICLMRIVQLLIFFHWTLKNLKHLKVLTASDLSPFLFQSFLLLLVSADGTTEHPVWTRGFSDNKFYNKKSLKSRIKARKFVIK